MTDQSLLTKWGEEVGAGERIGRVLINDGTDIMGSGKWNRQPGS